MRQRRLFVTMLGYCSWTYSVLLRRDESKESRWSWAWTASL